MKFITTNFDFRSILLCYCDVIIIILFIKTSKYHFYSREKKIITTNNQKIKYFNTTYNVGNAVLTC